jgi:hypothetical protein
MKRSWFHLNDVSETGHLVKMLFEYAILNFRRYLTVPDLQNLLGKGHFGRGLSLIRCQGLEFKSMLESRKNSKRPVWDE